MLERWTDIKGYEGLYEVSNLGNVRSLRYGKRKVLKTYVQNSGYIYVDLYKNKKKKHHLVHRLVAQAFIPNPKNLPEINHKDEDKFNNCVDNLEYCNHQYNQNYSLSKPVEQYDKSGKFIQAFKSASYIEKLLGWKARNIANCCRGKQFTSYGYIWKYI